MGRPGKSRWQRRERARLGSAPSSGSAPPRTRSCSRGAAPAAASGASSGTCGGSWSPTRPGTCRCAGGNSLRDLVAVPGPLGVSQFLVLSKSQTGSTSKFSASRGGPTLTFKVLQYSLVRDVVSALRRHRMHEQQFRHPPLLVLGISDPPDPREAHGRDVPGDVPGPQRAQGQSQLIRRCVLVSYDADSQLLEFRHYSIKVVPVGLSRGLRKLLQEKFPDLSRADDVSELLTGGVALSESEAEPDGTQNVLELPQNCAGRGNAATQQSAVRLTEPPKVRRSCGSCWPGRSSGCGSGSERRRKQEQDLERKRQQRLRHRERSLAGMGRAGVGTGGGSGGSGGGTGGTGGAQDGDSGAEDPGTPGAGEAEPWDEDEAEYYRQELGEEPDPDLFPSCSKRKRSPSGAPRARKRRRQSREGALDTPKSHPGTPKSHPGHSGTPKSQRGIPKSHPGTPKSHPGHSGTPKSHPGTPKSHPGHSGTPKSHPGTPKSHPGHSGTPKSQRGIPKSHPGTPKSHPRKPGTSKSQRRTPKSHPGTPKSHQGTPKSHPGAPKSHPGRPKNPKSQRRTPKSHPGTPKSHQGTPKSHPGHPKNPKSAPKPRRGRGKLLTLRKTPNFHRPGRARKGKN
ncbi:suppressor of SWI4 1 homolog isoform 3-T3 [Cyanocitta cristata]